jgi:hypothetical protein
MVLLGGVALVFRVRCWIEPFANTQRVDGVMNATLHMALVEIGTKLAILQWREYLVFPPFCELLATALGYFRHLRADIDLP